VAVPGPAPMTGLWLLLGVPGVAIAAHGVWLLGVAERVRADVEDAAHREWIERIRRTR
jgi:hypothetical protein